MLFLFNYLKLGIWSTIYYFRPSDLVFNIIVNNIKHCGPIVIKFVQWVLPKIETIYGIQKNSIDNEWFIKLEEIYENCEYHSLEYTKRQYKIDFKKDFDEDYKEVKRVASGSIGQVYKIIDKKGNTFAMKVLHPYIDYQLYFFSLLFLIIRVIPPFNNYLNYYFPINLHSFIKDFQMQTNLINEANHNIHFTNVYRDNPYIIIPQLYKFSKEIIIMSYEEGERFDTMDLSDYMNYKTILLLKLFNKNNEAIHQFMHGDLHKGNWKVRINKIDVKLVIYDFGFCWSIPPLISKNLVKMNQVFMNILLEEKTNKCNIQNINNFAEIAKIFCGNKISLQTMKEEITNLIQNEKLLFSDPIFFLRLILNSTRRENVTIDSYILGCIILHCQSDQMYGIIMKDNLNDNKEYNERYVYFKYLDDLVNFCETKHIFTDYIIYLKKELEVEKKEKNIKRDGLFVYDKKLDTFPFLKELSIQDS